LAQESLLATVYKFKMCHSSAHAEVRQMVTDFKTISAWDSAI